MWFAERRAPHAERRVRVVVLCGEPVNVMRSKDEFIIFGESHAAVNLFTGRAKIYSLHCPTPTCFLYPTRLNRALYCLDFM